MATYMTCDHFSIFIDGVVEQEWTHRRDDLLHDSPDLDESRYYEISIDTRSGRINALRLASVAEKRANPELAQSDLRQLVAGTQIPCPGCERPLDNQEELTQIGGPGNDEIRLLHAHCAGDSHG